LLFTPAAPPRTVQSVPGHNRWHPEIPPVAEVIAGGAVRLHCEGGDVLCGPIGMVGAEPGDLVMVEVLGLGRLDGRYAGNGHPGILGCAPSHAMLRDVPDEPSGALLGRVEPASADHVRMAVRAEPVRASCRALTPRTQILLPVHVPGARISAGDLHFPEYGRCETHDGWVDLRIHLTKRGIERFGITEPVVMPITTSSLDATVAGVAPDVRVRRAALDPRRLRTVDDAVRQEAVRQERDTAEDTEKER
jgi:formamidase